MRENENVTRVNVNEISIPISIFNNGSLGSFEAITKYLKENLKLRNCQIAYLLNRDSRTIWDSYASSRKKMEHDFLIEDTGIKIPLIIIRDRSLSVLETITEYLKNNLNLRYCQIASLLNRNDRTIWTVYNRARRKRVK